MAIYAVIDAKNKVINCIEWDGKSDWKAPSNTTVVQSDTASIGDIYDINKKTFTKFYTLPGYIFNSREQ